MALTREHDLVPWVPLPASARWPDAQPDGVKLVYDAPTDTLFAELFGTALPGIVWPVERDGVPYDGLSLKIDETTEQIVAVMVEGFLRFGVSAYPSWLALASYADIPGSLLHELGFAHSTEAGGRDAVISTFLADARVAWEDAIHAEAMAGNRG
jgi:hypothetical protein